MATNIGETYRGKLLTKKLQHLGAGDLDGHEAACRLASAEALCTVADAAEAMVELLKTIAIRMPDD